MQLTRNFKLSEFGKESEFNSYRLGLVKILANELQKVRDMINSTNLINFRLDKSKQIGMLITSGLRTQADYDRLKSKGYNPSASSDHFFGSIFTPVPTIGAADVRFTNFNNDYEGLYEILVYSDPTYFEFGQIILEYNPATKNYWMHFGNSPKLVFKDQLYSSFNKTKFLVSKDNGKTYTKYEGRL